MLLKRLVDALMKRSFKLDVSLMALWAVASWIHMSHVGSMEGDWGVFNKMSTCNVFFWTTMNQGCKCGGKLKSWTTFRNVWGRCASIPSHP
jgi:hypothetical protein